MDIVLAVIDIHCVVPEQLVFLCCAQNVFQLVKACFPDIFRPRIYALVEEKLLAGLCSDLIFYTHKKAKAN